MRNVILGNGISHPPQRLWTLSTIIMLYQCTDLTRLLIAVAVFTLVMLAGPERSIAVVPCQLNYSNDTELDWNGKTAGENYSFNKSEVSVFVPDCVGIKIKKGSAWVLWYHKHNGPRQTIVPVGTSLTESVFEEAQSGALLKEFHEFVGRFRSTLCGLCMGPGLPGTRTPTNSLGELLQNAFSGVLVFSPLLEITVPFRVPELQGLLSFKILSGDMPHQVISSVRFVRRILSIGTDSLEGEKSYVWQAEIGEVGSARVYTGSFKMPDASFIATTRGRLDKIKEASQGWRSLRQTAAWYFEQELYGNAVIALIQELDEIAHGE